MRRSDAQTLADALELDVHDTGICLACLGSVSFALDNGDEARIRRATNLRPRSGRKALRCPRAERSSVRV
jgi:hypothetical protein